MNKIVSQLNDAGYFICSVIADESPLEPNVFLIPGGAINVKPPVIPEGKIARWNDGTWEFVSPLNDSPIEEVPSLTPEEELANWRNTTVLTRFQFRAALYKEGLLNLVESFFTNTDDQFLKISWEDSATFKRMGQTILALQPVLIFTDEQLDDFFRFALAIED